MNKHTFKVGDRVRYVAVDSLALRKDGITGKITDVHEADCIIVDWGEGDLGRHNRKYLVKIQPPQEENKMNEKKEQIDIVNRKTGEIVRDVENIRDMCYSWKKVHNDRVITFSIEHWKRYEEWVKIEVNKKDWDKLSILAFQYNSDGNYTIGGVRWRYPQ